MRSCANKVSEKEKASSFVSGALILSVSTVIVKVIGLVYKIPMLSFLGAEGMGYFNAAYEIYALLCVISTAGLPTALSMLVSSYKASGRGECINKAYRSALLLFFALGATGTAFMLVFARPLSRLIENENTFYCLIAIAPALLCVCLSSAVRGYFQGFSKMIPTALSQLIEAVGKLLFGIAFAYVAISRGYPMPIVSAFAVAGLSLGTLISAVYLILLKMRRSHEAEITSGDKDIEKNKGTVSSLLRIAFPITLSAGMVSLTRVIDMALIMRRLQDIGYTVGVSNEIYGAYTTVAVPIFSLVPSLLTPISLALVPALSSAIENRSDKLQNEIVGTSIRLTALFAIPSSLAIVLYSSPIISLLFSQSAEGISYVSPLLSMLGASVFFSCMITTTNSILQSYRKTTKPIVSMAIGSVVKIAMAYILIGIPSVNVYGAPISTFLCDFIITVINLGFIRRETSRASMSASAYVKPLIASFAALLSSYALYRLIYLRAKEERLAFIAAVPVAVIIYFIVAVVIKAVRWDDISPMVSGRRTERIIKRIFKKETSKIKKEN